METTVTIDGREVRFRATAAVPRLYRIKFRRDIIQDFKLISDELNKAKPASPDGGKPQISYIPPEILETFENMAYIMAKHADKDAVPSTPEEWLDQFQAFSIYSIFPVIQALWDGNVETLDVAKKKLEQSIGT